MLRQLVKTEAPERSASAHADGIRGDADHSPRAAESPAAARRALPLGSDFVQESMPPRASSPNQPRRRRRARQSTTAQRVEGLVVGAPSQRTNPCRSNSAKLFSTRSSGAWRSDQTSSSSSPSPKLLRASNPSSSRARVGSPRQCRMSPARYLPTNCGTTSTPSRSASAVATCPIEIGRPVPRRRSPGPCPHATRSPAAGPDRAAAGPHRAAPSSPAPRERAPSAAAPGSRA